MQRGASGGETTLILLLRPSVCKGALEMQGSLAPLTICPATMAPIHVLCV